MSDLPRALRAWVTLGGCILAVGVLYWAQAFLVPLAIAVLLTFLLTPPVNWLERRVGRMLAITLIVLLVFSVLGAAGWMVARQLSGLADSLPSYRSNIREKMEDIRAAGRGGSVEKVQETLEAIQNDMGDAAVPSTGQRSEPVVVASQQVSTLWGFPAWVGPLVEPLSTVGFVIALAIFMLIQRQDLRDRLIGVLGSGHLTSTTRALDEAGRRVSRYLLMQSIVNATYGVAVTTGLYFLGVPYALLWGALGAVLRFIPYVGPLLAAGAPILVSLAALPGWERPMYVMGLFVIVELFTNMVMETLLYAGAAGVSHVGLLVAVGFWTWLWGPIGLLLATPLTVCLVVLGRHVPGFHFVTMLMADEPALQPGMRYYQRVLARDEAEAADILEEHMRGQDPRTVFDELMLPALNAAERDRIDGRLTPQEDEAVVNLTRELMDDAARFIARERKSAESPPADGMVAERSVAVLGYAAGGEGDELALRMLDVLLADLPVRLEIASSRMLASEIVADVGRRGVRLVCIADLPPSAPSKTRYLIRRLRDALPDLKIVVGRWAPPELADDTVAPLRQSGADFVGRTLMETREHLRSLVPHGAVASPAA